MIICVCSSCKFTDLLNNETEKTCFRCGGSFVSTGYDSESWLKLTTEEMTKVISDKYDIYHVATAAPAAKSSSTAPKTTSTPKPESPAAPAATKPASPDPLSNESKADLTESVPTTDSDIFDDFDDIDDFDDKYASDEVSKADSPKDKDRKLSNSELASKYIYEGPAATEDSGAESESQRSKATTLSIVAFILSFFSCTSLVGIILGIIDLAKNKGHKKGLSIAAIVIGCVFLIAPILLIALPTSLALYTIRPFLTDIFSNFSNAYSTYEYAGEVPDDFYYSEDDMYSDTFSDEDSELARMAEAEDAFGDFNADSDNIVDHDDVNITEENIDPAEAYSAYEEVYNSYSDKMYKEYIALAEEMENEATSGKSLEELSDSYTKKMETLSTLSQEAVEALAKVSSTLPATLADYTDWSSLLENEYIQYGTNLETIYTSGASNNVVDDVSDDINMDDYTEYTDDISDEEYYSDDNVI